MSFTPYIRYIFDCIFMYTIAIHLINVPKKVLYDISKILLYIQNFKMQLH